MDQPHLPRVASRPRRAAATLALALLGAGGGVAAQGECGPLANAYGPFDYWVHKAELPIVETAHFTPEVESLIRGKSSTIGGDLDYTLRAFPNHPRALIAMVNLGVKERTARPNGSRYPVECWLRRAIEFRPNDPNARLIYASFLSKAGKRADAVKQLEVAQASGASSPNFHYNMGLAYADVGDFERSLSHAHRAYQAGFTLPGLKNKLVAAGKWREPPPALTDPAAPTGSGAPAGKPATPSPGAGSAPAGGAASPSAGGAPPGDQQE